MACKGIDCCVTGDIYCAVTDISDPSTEEETVTTTLPVIPDPPADDYVPEECPTC